MTRLRSALSCNSVRYFSHSERQSSGNRVGILGVPFYKGGPKKGVDDGPNSLRKFGLVNILKNSTVKEIKDYGNLIYKNGPATPLQNMKNYTDFISCNSYLIPKVKEMLRENDQYLILGGDHSIGFGSVAGHLLHDPNTALVYVDAHCDLNLNEKSLTGNIHGMNVAFVLKELRKFFVNTDIEKLSPNCMPAKQLVYIGLRDVDPAEAYMIKKLGITAFAMDSVDKYGIGKLMEMTLDAIDPKSKIHISFDIDAMDASLAPSTCIPLPGGLSLREGKYIMESLQETGRVQGVDLVEINPHVGSEKDVNTTLSTGMELLKSVFGEKRSGNIETINQKDFGL